MHRRDLLALALLPCARSAPAADFPAREVRLVVPSGTGSSSDALGRELAPILQRRWRSPVNVENVGGTMPQLATQRVLREPADGHTIQVTNTSSFTTAALVRTLPFDMLADLRGVAGLAVLPLYLVVRTSAAWNSLESLLQASRRAPRRYVYGSAGPRSGTHIAMALLADLAQVQWLHAAFPGSQEAAAELVAGRLHLAMLPRGVALKAVATGKARIVAVTEPVPWPEASGLPVLSANYVEYGFRGIFGAAVRTATPPAAVDTLHTALRQAIVELDGSGRLAELGFIPATSSPAEFQRVMREQVTLWGIWSRRLPLD